MTQTQKGYLPRLNESRGEALDRVMGNQTPESSEPATSSVFPDVRRKVIRAGAAVLGATAAVAVAEAPQTARTLGDSFDTLHNALVVSAPPKPENATAITLGDTIRFRASDGKVKTVRVKTLSDITAAARQVDPTLDYGNFDRMLESEVPDSSTVQFGDKFTVDKSLGIEDIGHSG